VALLGAVLLSVGASAQKALPEGFDAPPAQLSAAAAAATAAAGAAECSLGAAEVDLNVNNVRAKIYNIGGLFWRGGGAQYEVPYNPDSPTPGPNSIFASGIWIAGLQDGNENDLRFAGSTYSNWEFWPGPLDASGQTTTARCASFDKLWKVNLEDLEDYTANGETATTNQDLLTWPIAQGAPYFLDTNGNDKRDPDEPRIELDLGDEGYSITRGGGATLDLAAGYRPDIIGDQAVWWVMNDNGNTHGWSGKAPLQVEVRAQAFAFSTADALNNTTFYRYQFISRNSGNIENTYVSLWSDPDLGQYTDDYVGSDPDLGLGFVYNGDSVDEGAGGYGALPPALGYDFFQGPLVGDGEGSSYNDGLDNDGDGQVDEENERLQVETFYYFTNQGGPTGDPSSSEDRGVVSYRLMQALWKDGTPFTRGGDGYNPGSTDFTNFAFPDDPPSYWSEYNSNGLGRANLPDDRRFGVVTGPFTFKPGDVQELVFGIVWAQAPQACAATATPQIASLQQLKFDDITVQGAFNADFNLPSPPPAVTVEATPLDQEIVLQWDSVTGDNRDIFEYSVTSPFAISGAPDDTYDFEGFKVFQYRDAQDTEGTLIGTFDINNSVTTVIDSGLDCATGAIVNNVVAQGINSGTATNTPTSMLIQNDAYTGNELRNNTTYYFGVQPYAYNEFSSPNRIFSAPVTRVSVRPSQVAVRNDGTVLQTSAGTSLAVQAADGNVGGGVITARVVDPASVTGDTYRVTFFESTDDEGHSFTNYRIVNSTTGEIILDGEEYFAETGEPLRQMTDVTRADGLAFDVQGPDPGPLSAPGADPAFVEITGPGGFDSCGPDAASTAGCPLGNNVYSSYNGTADYVGYHVGDGPEASLGSFAPNDYEIRFTDAGGYAVYGFSTDNVIPVPFEVWDIGLTPPGAENDPSDDERLIPFLFADAPAPECEFGYFGPTQFGLGNITQRIYGYYAVSGQSYDDFASIAETALAGDDDQCVVSVEAYNVADTGRGRPLQRFVMEQTGVGIDELSGTVIRFYTTDPNQPGDVFIIDTGESAALAGDAATAEAALDLIAVTPNPYRGASGYEVSGDQRIARIVNLPAEATIRIFTLSGTLVRELEKVNDGSTTIDWNLQSEAGLQIASGIYLIHVEGRRSDGSVIGERVLKFGVVQRRVQLDVY
jgi:hypothetical protein